ncbi:MAG: hypothetical protein HY925_15685 [Elusimicrobia bacterium]|nr:hypothetical protein [Elusimicrobiota bacterium]
MTGWRGTALLLLLALPSRAQLVAPVSVNVPVAPVPIGPHGAYFNQLNTQVQAMLSMPTTLPKAFNAAISPTPEVRTPAAFAARAAIAQALARPEGLQELAAAVESQDGDKAEQAAKSLRKLAKSIEKAGGAERAALGEQALALSARFDGATALPGESVDLSAIATNDSDGPGTKKSENALKEDRKEIQEYAEMLSAGKAKGVLVVLQGMDAGGKGGASKRSLLVPTSWARLFAFKKPTAEERAQHFLKRIEAALPGGKVEGAKGWIQIFDRSHYEDLIMPKILGTHSPAEIEARFKEVLDFEKKLAEAGIVVVKLFLHQSYDVQDERLNKRLKRNDKEYKATEVDWEMHQLFPRFMKEWGEVIARTSTPWSIWNIVPADHKARRDADVAAIVLKTLRRMGLEWPENPDLSKIRAVRDRVRAEGPKE